MDSRLHVFGVGDPAQERLRIVGQDAGAEAQAAAHVGQVRAHDAVGGRAADRVARAAAVGEKQLLAVRGERLCRRLCRRVLVREPDGEVLLLQDDHGKAHQGVRGPAVLGADAAEDAGPGRLQRQPVPAPWDHVDLAAEGRNPERVDDVGALQVKRHTCTDGQADLVGEFDGLAVAAGVR